MNDELHIIMWIDDETCHDCGYGQLVVMGPYYGQSSDYKVVCIHCKSGIAIEA